MKRVCARVRALLQIVYEFLLRYVVSNDTDAKTAKKYIDQVRTTGHLNPIWHVQ
jgi:Protein phosphatase 2A regulatory B subunit (B56 family)